MPVVSDASPLILLAKIRRLDLLKRLYSEVLINSETTSYRMFRCCYESI